MTDPPDPAEQGDGPGAESENHESESFSDGPSVDDAVAAVELDEGGSYPDDDGDQLSLADTNEYAAEAFGATESTDLAEPQPLRVLSIWPIWAWTMVGVLLVVIGLGIGMGVLSRTLVLDVASFWPAFVLIALVFAALIPRLRKGAPRLSAVLPLLLLTYLGVTVALHVARWDELPSTAADVNGPEVAAVTDGRIEVDLVGELAVRPVDQPELYRVLMVTRGGATGAPTTLEIINGGEASISVGQRADSGWFRSGGWDVELSLAVTWEVDATADQVDIDLSAVSSGDSTVSGDGTVVLGFVRPGSIIELDGVIDLVVREGDHIELVGNADVPADWATTEVGRSTPEQADRYTIIVKDNAVVTVRERQIDLK